MPDSSKILVCLSALRFGLVLILAGGIDIAINCAPSLFFLLIIGGIGKIVDLIWFIHIRKNGIPVEGRVYNRRESHDGKDVASERMYSYHLWVVYNVPRLNTHTECEAAASAKNEFLKETRSSNEVDEGNFTETEQKKNSFNVSEAAYDAVSVNDSIEVLALPGKAGYAKLSQTLSSDLKETCVLAAIYLLGGLAFGSLGIFLPFSWFSPTTAIVLGMYSILMH